VRFQMNSLSATATSWKCGASPLRRISATIQFLQLGQIFARLSHSWHRA
jgi:hypothetical protein